MVNSLPTFPITNAPSFDPVKWRLRVDGLLERKQDLSLHELMDLPSITLQDDFTCLEGWTVKGLEWKGVQVSTILDLVSVKQAAKCALFSSGDYTQGLTIERCLEPTTILAYELNGAPLLFEHGAPLRLVMKSQECFESIKWVHSINLTEEYADGSARRIALKRIGQRS